MADTYVAPYVDSTGLVVPSYSSILAYLTSNFQTIYGTDTYLEIDSADYQFLSLLALIVHDNNQACLLAYNNRGPQSAVGSGLDGIVKLNGISRNAASYSTCVVILTGTAGTIITNGVIQDENGYYWDLESSVTIGSGGTLSTTATCETIGAIEAAIGNLDIISTPTSGWTSVINAVAAVAGNPVETDSELRARQAISVTIPSQTILEGLNAALLAVDNINRVSVYENNTGTVDIYDLPAHSFTVIAEGGTDTDVAAAIYSKCGIGAYINGTTEIDTEDAYGNIIPIRFYRPSYANIVVVINLHSMSGYTSATTTAIKAAIYNYLNGSQLEIGATLSVSSLQGIALSVMTDLYNPIFSIRSLTMARSGSSQSTSDIVLAFYEAASTIIDNITINIVS